MMFTGFFTSKRGVEWNYHFGERGWIEMWHGTTERITGGWRIGRDVFSPYATKECYEDIEYRFGFKKNPDCEDAVIVPDMSHDELIERIEGKYNYYSTISKTPEGAYRVILFRGFLEPFRIEMFDSLEEARGFFVNRRYW